MPTLRATLNGKTVEKPITQTPITIGRQPGLGFTIPTKGASREHFRIGRLKDGGWAIKDLGSTNGTLLNGEKVDGARLKHGDRIEIGDCVIEFLDAPPPEPQEPKEKKPIILKSKRDKGRTSRKPEKKEKPKKEEKGKAKKEAPKIEAEPEPEPEPEAPAMHIESEEQLEEWLAKRKEFDSLLAGNERRSIALGFVSDPSVVGAPTQAPLPHEPLEAANPASSRLRPPSTTLCDLRDRGTLSDPILAPRRGLLSQGARPRSSLKLDPRASTAHSSDPMEDSRANTARRATGRAS